MCYMESKMQDQIESGIMRMEELERQYDYFCDWYLRIPDADETLISKEYLDERFDLYSPADTVSNWWIGWRAAKGI